VPAFARVPCGQSDECIQQFYIFFRPEPILFFFQVSPQLYSRGWVGPVPDPLLLRKSGRVGNQTRTSGSVARNSDHWRSNDDAYTAECQNILWTCFLWIAPVCFQYTKSKSSTNSGVGTGAEEQAVVQTGNIIPAYMWRAGGSGKPPVQHSQWPHRDSKHWRAEFKSGHYPSNRPVQSPPYVPFVQKLMTSVGTMLRRCSTLHTRRRMRNLYVKWLTDSYNWLL
jgi:hypothetical protein